MTGNDDVIFESKKIMLSGFCETCNRDGYIFIDDVDQSCIVICKACGSESSQVWCPKCGMGGDFVRDIYRHPSSWVCSDCKNEYPLLSSFYSNPVSLYLEDMLPAEILDRIKNSGGTGMSFSLGKLIKYPVLLIMFLALWIGPLFLPFVLAPAINKLLNMNSDGLITVICFIVWLPVWFYLLDKVQSPLNKLLYNWTQKNSG